MPVTLTYFLKLFTEDIMQEWGRCLKYVTPRDWTMFYSVMTYNNENNIRCHPQFKKGCQFVV